MTLGINFAICIWNPPVSEMNIHGHHEENVLELHSFETTSFFICVKECLVIELNNDLSIILETTFQLNVLRKTRNGRFFARSSIKKQSYQMFFENLFNDDLDHPRPSLTFLEIRRKRKNTTTWMFYFSVSSECSFKLMSLP